jgi:hypothetical protein
MRSEVWDFKLPFLSPLVAVKFIPLFVPRGELLNWNEEEQVTYEKGTCRN